MAVKSAPNPLLPSSIRLVRVLGIPIALHVSWFIIAALITISLGAHFRQTHADWRTGLVWSVAAGTAVLFFVTLLLHELAHAVVAHARGLPVRSITLFALGGIAAIEKDAESARSEFEIAAVGPLVSFVIGFSCIAAARALGWTFENGTGGVAGSMLGWLGSINVALAVFNLVPAYPLDGGRILRAIMWGINKSRDRASRAAARVGQIVSGIFIAWGLLQFVFAGNFGGLWLAFIGWFLYGAAQASYAEVAVGDALRDVRVADVMANECVTVDRDIKVQSLVDDVLLRTGRRCVVVRNDGRMAGFITPHDLVNIDRHRWPDVAVGDVMQPLETLNTVTPATPAADALRSMMRSGLTQLPVVDDGRLEGIVTRTHILQLLQSRTELSKAS